MKRTVFVTQHGAGNMDGTCPENAAPLAEALGMTKYKGGTIVVCGPLAFERHYNFPSDHARITITSVYNGIDYRESGAALMVSANLSFYGDYTLENLKLVAEKDGLYLFFRFNNVTVGSGIICELSGEAKDHIGIYCGCDAQSASYRDTLWESCKCDARAEISSGKWSFVRGGNRRAAIGAYPGTPHRSVFGTVIKDVNYSVTVNGGEFTGGEYSAVTGMNSVDGSTFMEINGGSFNAPLYLVCEGGENPDELERRINGNITLQINGGEFESPQVISGDGHYGASLTVSVCEKLFNKISVLGAEKNSRCVKFARDSG